MPVQKVVSRSSTASVQLHLPDDDAEAPAQMMKFMVGLRDTYAYDVFI